MNATLEFLLLVFGIIFIIGSFDDFFLDFIHFFLVPDIQTMEKPVLEEGHIAVLIPAWQEASVLEAMVKTNLRRLKYSNYKFYIGVYPNDPETIQKALWLEVKYPDLVTMIITDAPGPTSKAHCLNCIWWHMEVRNIQPKFYVIHDAEDVIHPMSFAVVNEIDADFIQVPIFSLPISKKLLVGGTYLDEFAEIHLKEIPTREYLGMPIPSAGVGTFLSRRALLALDHEYGYAFDEQNLTEDYEMSLRVAKLKLKQRFLLLRDDDGQIIATREYFPDALDRSIRQKTRWTTGIGLQTWRKWAWFDGLWDMLRRAPLFLYALYRDRKSLIANPAALLGWILFIIVAVKYLIFHTFHHVNFYWELKILFIINTIFMFIRVSQRVRFTTALYGWGHGLVAMPRIFISNYINGLAAFRAIYSFFKTTKKTEIKWDKTDHKFPTIT